MMIYNTHNARIDPVAFPLKYAKVCKEKTETERGFYDDF